MNNLNQFVLTGKVSEYSKQAIIAGIKEIENIGFTYFRPQFVEYGKLPKPGLPTCSWHNLW